MKILVIDDNQLHIKMCTILLEKNGHEVSAFMSLDDLKKAPKNMEEQDAALIDYRLQPGETGVDVVNYLKNDRKWKKTRFIALTADVGENELLKSAGFDSILYKPITERQLMETLK